MSDFFDQVQKVNHYEISPFCDMRDKVFAMEHLGKSLPKIDLIDKDKLKENELAQTELQVKHHFSNGIYIRELIIPKDTIIVGKIHKYQNLNILLKGVLDVLIEGEIKRIEAPFITVSPPGTKRIARAFEDSIWLTVHGTNELDLAKIEEHFIAQSETEWLEFCKSEPMLPLEVNCGQNGSFENPNWPKVEMK